MLAAVLQDGELGVRSVQEPTPGPRHLLTKPLACGICGSDLHALDAPSAMADLHAAVVEQAPHSPLRGPRNQPEAAVMLGHEFCAEVLDVGTDVSDFSVGDIVVSVPRLFDNAGARHSLGFSAEYPGGLATHMLVDADSALRVDPDADPLHAALTEPLAVGRHAVARSGITKGQMAVVVGCGPIGLGLIAHLVAAGCGPIVAIDPSDGRREIAETLGADHVLASDEELPSLFVTASEPPVFFEAVGKAGMLDRVSLIAPPRSHIVVVGACLGVDSWRPMLALGRELTFSFVIAYDDDEFAQTLQAITKGVLNVAPMISGTVPLSDVTAAFDRLRHPDGDAKVLVVGS